MKLKRLLLLLCTLLTSAGPAVAAETPTEQEVRAALLFNFLKFTEWPAAAAGDPAIRICVATGDPAQFAAIEALRHHRMRNKPVTVVRIGRQADCDVLYVDSQPRWKEMIAGKHVAGHVLTIGAHAGFVADGGMIEISMQEGSPRFDINQAAAKRADLRFYPQLLRLARRVVE